MSRVREGDRKVITGGGGHTGHSLNSAVLGFAHSHNQGFVDLLWDMHLEGASVAEIAAAAEMKAPAVIALLRKHKKSLGVKP